jgi:hypothetical protein
MQSVCRSPDRWLRDPIFRRARESTRSPRSAYIAQAAMRAPLRDGSRARRRQTQMAKRSQMQGGLRRSRAAPRCRRSPLVQAPVRRPRPATLFAECGAGGPRLGGALVRKQCTGTGCISWLADQRQTRSSRPHPRRPLRSRERESEPRRSREVKAAVARLLPDRRGPGL